MRKLLAFLTALSVLTLSSCKTEKNPDNIIRGTDIVSTGYKPDPRGVTYQPVETFDTLYTIAPTWSQAIGYAGDRRDRNTWLFLGFGLLLIFAAAWYGRSTEARWFPRMGDLFFGVLLFLLGAGAFTLLLGTSASIKWNNDKQVKKQDFDRALKETGSTRPLWDSMAARKAISWGPY